MHLRFLKTYLETAGRGSNETQTFVVELSVHRVIWFVEYSNVMLSSFVGSAN